MKLLTIITLFLAGFAVTAASQTTDCQKFRTGKFYYPTLTDKHSIRTETTQESYNNGKLEMVWKVKWLSECRYELICEKVLIEPYPIKVGDRIIATIEKTEGDCSTTSILFFNEVYPQGQEVPGGDMCIKRK